MNSDNNKSIDQNLSMTNEKLNNKILNSKKI